MDLGCYPVHWVRSFLREEPAVTSATATLNSLGADMSMVAELKFPTGPTAIVTCRMDEGPVVQTLDVDGTLGSLRVNGLLFASYGHSIEETVEEVTSASSRRDQIPVVATPALDIVGPLPCTKHGADVLGRVARAVTRRRLVCTGVELLHLGDDFFSPGHRGAAGMSCPATAEGRNCGSILTAWGQLGLRLLMRFRPSDGHDDSCKSGEYAENAENSGQPAD